MSSGLQKGIKCKVSSPDLQIIEKEVYKLQATEMDLRKQFVDQIRPNHEKVSYINDETSKGCHFYRWQEVMLHEGEQPAGPNATMNTLEHKPGKLKCKHLKKNSGKGAFFNPCERS